MAGVKGKGSLFTEQEYKKIKEILNVGVSIAQTSKIVGRSSGVVSYVNRTKDYAEYKSEVAKRYAKPEEKKVVTAKEVNQLPEVNTTLKQLTRIADALEKIADKKGFLR